MIQFYVCLEHQILLNHRKVMYFNNFSTPIRNSTFIFTITHLSSLRRNPHYIQIFTGRQLSICKRLNIGKCYTNSHIHRGNYTEDNRNEDQQTGNKLYPGLVSTFSISYRYARR